MSSLNGNSLVSISCVMDFDGLYLAAVISSRVYSSLITFPFCIVKSSLPTKEPNAPGSTTFAYLHTIGSRTRS